MFPTPRSKGRTKGLYPGTKISVDEEKYERGKTIAINQGGNDDACYDPQYLVTV